MSTSFGYARAAHRTRERKSQLTLSLGPQGKCGQYLSLKSEVPEIQIRYQKSS